MILCVSGICVTLRQGWFCSNVCGILFGISMWRSGSLYLCYILYFRHIVFSVSVVCMGFMSFLLVGLLGFARSTHCLGVIAEQVFAVHGLEPGFMFASCLCSR